MKAIIIGGGQVGSYVAKLLIQNNYEVSIIENREKPLEKIRHDFTEEMLVRGTGSDPDTLERAGINQADVVVAVTGEDQVNLVVATIAKYEYGTKRVIARVNNPRNTWLFNQSMGVDVAVNQADLVSRIVMDEIDMKSLSTLLKINKGKNSIVQMGIQAGSRAENKMIKDLQLPEETVLITLIREDDAIVINGSVELKADDTVIALTNEKGQYALNDLFSK
ncbi:TrkA family potassium uptake protein [Erysipelothrix sp. HDW6B]|uniref:potassium channel family protein n=1 Tax=Erysipelothrix sp. HDW6B TaxID=2714929 RepID=UPI00140DDA93|nr:TrkA family potassium uptake protein [Erysipelothrix sp. HDW6B]QIK86590.1 TrkA family potassium uptake protein [Erysipelothrix sp. HDW6B]